MRAGMMSQKFLSCGAGNFWKESAYDNCFEPRFRRRQT